MNPLTQTRNIMKMNDRELELGVAGTKNSWHNEYKDSAWVFMGGMPYELTEGDLICMFSQYGEVVHINLIRDHTTGKSKGFGFLCYEDQRSTILAVDNLNGFKILGRMIRVDHIHQYKLPKDLEKLDQDKRALFMSGVAPKPISESEPESSEEELLEVEDDKKSKKKKKKEKKKHKKKKKKKDKGGGSSDEDDSEDDRRSEKKKEKYANGNSHRNRSRSPQRKERDSERLTDRKRDRSRDKVRDRSRSRDKGRDRSRERKRSPYRREGDDRKRSDKRRSRSRDRRRDRS